MTVSLVDEDEDGEELCRAPPCFPLAARLALADAAVAIATSRIHVDVFWRHRVAAPTGGPRRWLIARLNRYALIYVHARRHGIKVPRVDAPPIATEVVEVQAFWDVADDIHVCPSVSAPRAAVITDEVPISILIRGADPSPAVAVLGNAQEEPLILRCTASGIWLQWAERLPARALLVVSAT